MSKTTKIMWFSRHEMTEPQWNELQEVFGNIEVTQVNETIDHVSEIANEIEAADVLAIVAPIHLQKQFLDIAGDRPVLMAKNLRTFDDNGKVHFRFGGWEQLLKIEIKTRKLKDGRR